MRAIKIPTRADQPIEVVEVGSEFASIAKVIGRGCTYVEPFRCPLTPEHNLVGVCDEDGQFSGRQPENIRAWPLYPMKGYHLRGDVLVMQEGFVGGGRDFIDLANPTEALQIVRDLLEGATHA